ncbi:MAG: autotransporter outer membrane beta-barrel domain-containing protein [Alphaproteobacteria bacterium]|nr:autotransporter outer membrane beta-barrel domain-containing protein [Alphaproteobacteria bacterium]
MGSFLTLTLNPFSGSPGGSRGGIGVGRGFATERELPPEVAYAYAAVTPKDRQRPSSVFSPNWTIWGQAYGGTNKTNGDAVVGSNDTTAHGYGFATGIDHRVLPDTTVGFALAGGGTSFGIANGLGSGRSDVFQMGVYGIKQFGASYVSAALSYARHWMATNRTVTVSGTDQLTASFNANNIGGRIETGHRFKTPVVGITPYAALQVQQFRTPPYAETATSGTNAFALSYSSNTATVTRTELGSWFDKTFALNSTSAITLWGRTAWAHDHSSSQSVNVLFQTLPGSNFTVSGAAVAPNSVLLSAGGEIRRSNGMSFGAKLDSEFSGRSQSYAGTGTVRYAW